ncbi:MAG: lipocalin family protein, partial [Alistipes sp.]|nr:lipocalin family protein [Alistipes sp.]
CSKDEDDKGSDKKGNIVGTWVYSDMEDYPSYYYIWVFYFTEDGRFAEMDAEYYNGTEYEDEYYGTYTYSGKKLVLYYEDGDVWALQATISGNRLTISDEDGGYTFERYVEE